MGGKRAYSSMSSTTCRSDLLGWEEEGASIRNAIFLAICTPKQIYGLKVICLKKSSTQMQQFALGCAGCPLP